MKRRKEIILFPTEAGEISGNPEDVTSFDVVALTTEADPEKIAALREVVTRHSMRKIDGQLVDVVTAQAILLVWDNLSEPRSRERFLGMSIPTMARVAWKLVK